MLHFKLKYNILSSLNFFKKKEYLRSIVLAKIRFVFTRGIFRAASILKEMYVPLNFLKYENLTVKENLSRKK